MPNKRLRELNSSAAGGLNTFKSPPTASVASYPPSESSRSRRHTLHDPKDASHSRFFPTPERHRAHEVHDITRSESQEDPYDFQSNSSTGKSKVARIGVEEYRLVHPKTNARRSRMRKSRSLLGLQKRMEAAGKIGKTKLDRLNDVLPEYDPPPANIRSDIVRGQKRSRPASCRTETLSPHFKRPRIHQSIESIESEDELDDDRHGEVLRTNFPDLVSPKRMASRGDIQTTQFSKPRSKPCQATVSAMVPDFHVRRAVSGKNIFGGIGEECELLLQQAHGEPLLLSPKCTRDTKTPLDWLAIDLDKVTRMEHAATNSHVVHVVRPRSNNFESSLWLELMEHRDVLGLIGIAKVDQLAKLPGKQLEIKCEQAWNKAKNYRQVNSARPASTSSTARDQFETIICSRQGDEENTTTEPRRAVKLVDQMRDSLTAGQRSASEAREETICATVPTAPSTRRTRRSSPVVAPRVASPERWTHQNPDWTAQWHQSLVFPATGKNRATVDDIDIRRLDEGEFLNDNLISFYIRYLQFKLESEKPEILSKVYFFSTFFFEKLRSTKGKINYDGVKAWTAKVDLFSYDYIVVPVNEHAHWYLAIICNASNAVNGIAKPVDDTDSPGSAEGSSPRIEAMERDMSKVNIRDGDTKQQSGDVEILHSPPSSAKPREKSSSVSKTAASAGSQTNTAAPRHEDLQAPKIITLDSLASTHPTTCKALREYLVAEAKDKKGVDLVKIPLGMTAKKIPEQDNFCDCGVFVLGYMEEFLKDPDGTVHKLLRRERLGWDIRPSQLRNSLRELLFKMQREQHERLIEEKQQKRLLSAKKKALASQTDGPTRRVDESVSLTPCKKSSVRELSGTSGHITKAVSKASPAVVPTVVVENHAQSSRNARSSPIETVAKSPTGASVKHGAALPKPCQITTSADNKGCAGGTHSLHSSTSPASLKGVTAVSGTRNATATASSPGPELDKQDLVETLPVSSSEAEMEVQVTQTRPRKKRKRKVIESTDVEEVMSIKGSRATRQRSTKQLESASSVVQPPRSRHSLSPQRMQAKYQGIERSVDLT